LTYFLDKCFKTPDSIPRIRRRLSETFRAQYINTKEIRSNILPLYPGNIRANSSYTHAEFLLLLLLFNFVLLGAFFVIEKKKKTQFGLLLTKKLDFAKLLTSEYALGRGMLEENFQMMT
jgi:hypothetical protein